MIKIVTGSKLADTQNLSVCDINSKRANTYLAFAYDYNLPETELFESLSTLLDLNPYLGGRIHGLRTTSPTLEGSNQGVIFSVCRYNSAMPDFSIEHLIKEDSNPTQYLLDSNVDDVDETTPLVQVKLSQYENGAVVCVTFFHALCDGIMFAVLRDWSMLVRKKTVAPPEMNRNLLSSTYKKTIENQTDSGLDKAKVEYRTSNTKKLGFGAFELPGDAINSQFEKAAQNNHSQDFISRQDFVMAYILRELFSCIDSEEVDYAINTVRDVRKIMGLPANYFGNAASGAVLIKKYTALREESVFSLAKSLRQSVEELDLNKVCLSLKQRFEYINNTNNAREQPSDVYIDNIVILNNYTKMPVYDIDFGSGPPIWAESLAGLVERHPFNARLIVAWPSPAQDGGVIYHINAPMEDLVRLKSRFEKNYKSSVGELKPIE